MIISISGAHGSGKSTVAEKLALILGWPRYYMGGLRREAAKKRGMTLAEYNKLGENDPLTDQEVDDYQKELGETRDNFIIEGRTSWFFIPHSLKLYLDVEDGEGSRRIFRQLQSKNDRNEDKELMSQEAVEQSLHKRLESDRLRYKKYYNIDVNDKKHFDFYLDTTKMTPEEVLERVLECVKNSLDNTKN